MFSRKHWTGQKYIRKKTNLTRICTEKYGRLAEWKSAEVVPLRCFLKQLFWKYQQSYRRTSIWKRDFNKVGFTTLLKSHFRTSVFMYICYIFAEHIFWRTPTGDCLRICNVIKLVKAILKGLWYFAYLSYPLLLKLFFYKWCNYVTNIHVRDIKMLGMNCSFQLWKRIIQAFCSPLSREILIMKNFNSENFNNANFPKLMTRKICDGYIFQSH